MTAPALPDAPTRCYDCGHDHHDCECTCTCGAIRRLAGGASVTHFAELFCDRPPHDPAGDPLHYDDEDALWWLEAVPDAR